MERLFDSKRREALLRFLPSSPRGAAQFARGPLWLAAASGNMAQDGERCLAMEGFIAYGKGGETSLESALERKRREPGWEPRFSGHYVLVCAEPQAGRLTLLRDPSGSECLYFFSTKDLLLFATSLKILLSCGVVPRKLDADAVAEMGLAGILSFGNSTLVEGVYEVLAGHRLIASEGALKHQWRWPEILRSPKGDPKALAREFRDSLMEGIRASIGSDQETAVSLSGGIDSAAIAALAVEAVGARNVQAFTYEFEDDTHPSETHYAALVCRHFGIRRHHVIKITRQEYLSAIPETLWRTELASNWRKAFILIFSREIRKRGFTKYLTGFGIGSHMGYFDDLARVLAWVPAPDLTLRYWKRSRFTLKRSPLVPSGLEAPYPSIYFMLLAVLQRNGIIRDSRHFYPESLGPLIMRAMASPRIHESMKEIRSLPLASQLQYLSFTHLNSCMDVTRIDKLAREAGAFRISPAHFPKSTPYAYFPLLPRPSPLSLKHRPRPGKVLLHLAMKDLLPEPIMTRPKLWLDKRDGGNRTILSPLVQANVSQAWLMRAMEEIESAASFEPLRPYFGAEAEALRRSILEPPVLLALWNRMFIDAPPSPDSFSGPGVRR